MAHREVPGIDRRYEVVGSGSVYLRLQANKVSFDVALESVILLQALFFEKICRSTYSLPWLGYGFAGPPTAHILTFEVTGMVTDAVGQLTGSQLDDPLRSIAVGKGISAKNKFIIAFDFRL